MSPEPMLAILYDLSRAISSEKRVQPLLKRVLQRLLFHTSLPAGIALLGQENSSVAECAAVVGEPFMAGSQGAWLSVSAALMEPLPGWINREQLHVLCLSERWDQALRLPIPGAGIFLLLLPVAAKGQRPQLTEILLPAMHSLGHALGVCRADEDARNRLSQDRDQARHDLANALRESEERGRLLRQLSDALPDMFWLKSMEGRYLFCNRALCDFMGRDEASMIGCHDDMLFDEQAATMHSAHDETACREHGLHVYDQQAVSPITGQKYLFEITKMLVKDDHGSPLGIMGIAHDISKRRAQESELRRAASVFVHARDGIMITEADGTIIDVNQAFTQITGYSRDEVVGNTPRMLRSGVQDPDFYEKLWAAISENGYWSGELWNKRRSGELYAQQMTISAVHDDAGNLQQYVALFYDVSKQKAYEQELLQVAYYDALTGLPNRILLGEMLAQAAKHAQQHRLHLAVAYLDLDGFKDINDAHGHAVGDRFLQVLSNRMAAEIAHGDTLARVGGDEFIVLLCDVDSKKSALARLDALCQVAASPVSFDGLRLQVSASIGLAMDDAGDNWDADLLIRQADHAMYQAKLQGKNRCCVFEADSEREFRGQQEFLREIGQGLERGEFILYYQPKVNMRSGALIGAEALIRWHHPERGLLMPSHFLPAIEHHDLSVTLGQWVITQALQQIAQWHAQGWSVQVSVNIGARHLQQATFLDELDRMLRRYPYLPAELLQLEIVETSALDDIDHVSRLLNACRQLGVSSAIDDFGTGYSSLSYLKRLPVQQLKVDKSFVREMLDDPDDLAILEGILGLARAFDCDVIAEGVESEEHGTLLLQLGCELGQGYGIGRPMPADAMRTWFAAWQPPGSWRDVASLVSGQVMIMRACIYLRAWLKAIDHYLVGKSDVLPEMDPYRCRFSRWLARVSAERKIEPTMLAHINEQHLSLNALGCSVVEVAQEMEADTLGTLRLRLQMEGQALIASLLEHGQPSMAAPVPLPEALPA